MGPEIAAEAWRTLRGAGPAFALIADPGLMTAHAPVEVVASPAEALTAFADALPVLDHGRGIAGAKPAQPDPGAAPGVVAAIEHAVALCLEGRARAVVTNPIAKSILYQAGFDQPGHTEFVARLTEGAPMEGPAEAPRGPVMMLVGGGLRVALATIHVPLRAVPGELSVERIVRVGRVTAAALRRDFGVPAPRLAVAGLNPHAGEKGALGEEDDAIIAPAVAELRRHGVDARGPLPGDALFHAEARGGYDAAIAMYHDQGLIPVKTLDFHGGVNVTLGLPIVRTSPDHGTAFDIAGQGKARADSLIAALRLADRMACARAGLAPSSSAA